jgi:hypothetical protein
MKETAMMATNDKIIEAAKLQMKLEQIDKERELASAHHEWKTALSELEPADIAASLMVSKVLSGNRQLVTSDNPDTIQRWRSLAKDIGATVEDGGNPYPMTAGMIAITILPPPPTDDEDDEPGGEAA